LILSNLIYFLVKFFHSTYRYRFLGLENIKEAQSLSKMGNYIFGIWHQNLLHGIFVQTGNPHVVIVSKSKDADPVAHTCRRIGTIVVRGSSRNKAGVDKGGKEAKAEMIEKLKEGHPGAITIDGPKGPAKEVKPGIIDMAIKSESVIVPYLPIAEKYWSFNSWDKFRFPKPFSRILVHYGEPIKVDPQKGFEFYQEELKAALETMEEEIHTKFSDWKSFSKKNWNQNK
jgi:lysophospholipid acyltransferase (LPLAT)-like uncharacterized protein